MYEFEYRVFIYVFALDCSRSTDYGKQHPTNDYDDGKFGPTNRTDTVQNPSKAARIIHLCSSNIVSSKFVAKYIATPAAMSATYPSPP